MPNWCKNVAVFHHPDNEMMYKLKEAISNNELLNSFIPRDVNNEDWYNWCIDNWGTKWDIIIDKVKTENKDVEIIFESAWTPPINFYNTMAEKGFHIKAAYLEIDMLLVGEFINGEHKHFKLCFETYENLPEFILSYYKDDIESYKEILGL
jgi:hypothetical protein